MGAKEERQQPRRVQRRVMGLPGFPIRKEGVGGVAALQLKEPLSYEFGTERTTPFI